MRVRVIACGEHRMETDKRKLKIGSRRRRTGRHRVKGKGAYCHGDILQHCYIRLVRRVGSLEIFESYAEA
jgi:hypothetical protein